MFSMALLVFCYKWFWLYLRASYVMDWLLCAFLFEDYSLRYFLSLFNHFLSYLCRLSLLYLLMHFISVFFSLNLWPNLFIFTNLNVIFILFHSYLISNLHYIKHTYLNFFFTLNTLIYSLISCYFFTLAILDWKFDKCSDKWIICFKRDVSLVRYCVNLFNL